MSISILSKAVCAARSSSIATLKSDEQKLVAILMEEHCKEEYQFMQKQQIDIFDRKMEDEDTIEYVSALVPDPMANKKQQQRKSSKNSNGNRNGDKGVKGTKRKLDISSQETFKRNTKNKKSEKNEQKNNKEEIEKIKWLKIDQAENANLDSEQESIDNLKVSNLMKKIDDWEDYSKKKKFGVIGLDSYLKSKVVYSDDESNRNNNEDKEDDIDESLVFKYFKD